MQNKRQIIFVIILIGLLTAAGSLLTNVVSVGIVIPQWLAGSLLIVAIGWGIGLTVWQFLLQRDNETVTASQQDRQRLLAKVHSFWIKGVLERSLYNVVHIELGLHEQPDAIANPWHLVLQQHDQPAHPLPSSTHIIQVYDDALGELLILGEPGSGKTTLLLELARDLLRRAEADESHPMPIVFNLSSWAVKRQPLTDWLVEEMNTKYQVSRKLVRSWVESNQVLPLLDGLDEVNSDHREACVDAINTYRLQHGLVPMVVCSRSADYLELKKHILLRTAVVVQPLITKQIDDYLSAAGGQLEAVRVALRDDSVLQELATTPLMLSVLSLAYYGMSVKDFVIAGSSETRRRQVFEAYVQRMLKRRGTETHYIPQQTIHWMTWLAKQMEQHNQTEFYIESMRPDWFQSSKMRCLYRCTIIIFSLLIGIIIGFLLGTLGHLFAGFISMQVSILIGGITGGLVGSSTPPQRILRPPEEVITVSPIDVIKSIIIIAFVLLLSGLVLGLVIGFFIGLINWFHSKMISNLFLGLLSGVVYGEIYGCVLGLVSYLLWIENNGPISLAILHILLWRTGCMPLDYPRFLDYAAERILLRKVGGGYIFVHRMLLEYFASLDTTP